MLTIFFNDSGYHTLYQWYRSVESEHFPDPTGLRARIEQWTFGLYPACIKYLMSAFDVPEVWKRKYFWTFLVLIVLIMDTIMEIIFSGYGRLSYQYLQTRIRISFPRGCYNILRFRLPLFLGFLDSCRFLSVWELLIYLHQLASITLRWSVLVSTYS